MCGWEYGLTYLSILYSSTSICYLLCARSSFIAAPAACQLSAAAAVRSRTYYFLKEELLGINSTRSPLGIFFFFPSFPQVWVMFSQYAAHGYWLKSVWCWGAVWWTAVRVTWRLGRSACAPEDRPPAFIFTCQFKAHVSFKQLSLGIIYCMFFRVQRSAWYIVRRYTKAPINK